jgi:hypothetical protein
MKLFDVSTITIMLLLFTTNNASSSGLSLKSGLYGESLRLALGDKGTVSGYFVSSGGFMGNNGWRCSFYFSGTGSGHTANIVASSIFLRDFEVRTFTTGTITKVKSNDEIVIKLDEPISGCAQGENFFDDTPAPIRLNTRYDSFEAKELKLNLSNIEYRVVKKKKSFFFHSSLVSNHMKSYVVCGDVVLVTETDSIKRRAKSRFVGTRSVTEGWLSIDDFAPIGERLTCER